MRLCAHNLAIKGPRSRGLINTHFQFSAVRFQNLIKISLVHAVAEILDENLYFPNSHSDSHWRCRWCKWQKAWFMSWNHCKPCSCYIDSVVELSEFCTNYKCISHIIFFACFLTTTLKTDPLFPPTKRSLTRTQPNGSRHQYQVEASQTLKVMLFFQIHGDSEGCAQT